MKRRYAVRVHLLFTRFPLESSYGGAEVQTLSLMKGLRERGHTVEFLGSCSVLLAECAKAGIPATQSDIGMPPVTKWGATSFLWRKRKMRDVLTKKVGDRISGVGTIDGIVMLSLSEKLLLTPWARSRSIPVYWLEHDRIGRWLTWNPWLPRLRTLSKTVTTIVVSALSGALYERMGWDPKTIVVIPNGIDLRRFGPAPAPRLTSTLLRIGGVARLTRDKGVDLLITAMKDHPQASLSIIGTGKEENSLRTLIEKHDLGSRVSLAPHTDDLGTFYQDLDLLILPSREHDPFGLVAAEAMSLGIPVIVTDACGIANFLEDGTDAVIVPAGSSLAIGEGILRLANQVQRERMGREGKETAMRLFALDRMIDAYEGLFERRTVHD